MFHSTWCSSYPKTKWGFGETKEIFVCLSPQPSYRLCIGSYSTQTPYKVDAWYLYYFSLTTENILHTNTTYVEPTFAWVYTLCSPNPLWQQRSPTDSVFDVTGLKELAVNLHHKSRKCWYTCIPWPGCFLIVVISFCYVFPLLFGYFIYHLMLRCILHLCYPMSCSFITLFKLAWFV